MENSRLSFFHTRFFLNSCKLDLVVCYCVICSWLGSYAGISESMLKHVLAMKSKKVAMASFMKENAT